MTSNLPGNPFAETASHFAARAHEAALANKPEKTEARAAVAQVYATLANAYETRTQTLAQLFTHNSQVANSIYGVDNPEMPDGLVEMLREQGEELSDRLGRG